MSKTVKKFTAVIVLTAFIAIFVTLSGCSKNATISNQSKDSGATETQQEQTTQQTMVYPIKETALYDVNGNQVSYTMYSLSKQGAISKVNSKSESRGITNDTEISYKRDDNGFPIEYDSLVYQKDGVTSKHDSKVTSATCSNEFDEQGHMISSTALDKDTQEELWTATYEYYDNGMLASITTVYPQSDFTTVEQFDEYGYLIKSTRTSSNKNNMTAADYVRDSQWDFDKAGHPIRVKISYQTAQGEKTTVFDIETNDEGLPIKFTESGITRATIEYAQTSEPTAYTNTFAQVVRYPNF